MRRPLFIEIDAPRSEDQRQELVRGLQSERACISPKFFYDALGSRLFEAICELPEYYLPRTEREIMDACGAEIAEAIGTGCTLIDLGAGNCEKAERLFALLQPAQYVAVDIAGEFLRGRLDSLQVRHPRLDIVGVGQDFSQRLLLPPPVRREKRLFFYPGSSIGNFSPEEAAAFISRIRALCGRDGRILLGVDLVKDRSVLEAAYDDSLGVTAAFNLNILNSVNRVLGSDFDVRDWQHVAAYNERESRIEMHVEARRPLRVRLGSDGSRAFAAGERIHTENSYKADGAALAALWGQATERRWTDRQRRFLVALF
jgi:dimethylhistidine N-methyltransferase